MDGIFGFKFILVVKSIPEYGPPQKNGSLDIPRFFEKESGHFPRSISPI